MPDNVPANMSPSQVRVIDPILTTVAIGYRNPQFVGGVLFPRVPVEISGGQVLEFGKEDFLKYNIRRAPGSDTKRISFGYLGKPFALLQDALDVPIPREFQRDASVMPGIDLGTRATQKGMRVVTKSLEEEQAAIALNAANYDANHKVALAGADKWSDPASLPGPQLDDYREAVRASTGEYPNVMVVGATAFKALRNNPSVIDRFKYTSKESITAAMLAALYELDVVAVARSITSDDAGVFSDIWGNNAVLAYVPQQLTGIEEPSYGYTYTMVGHPLVEQPYWDPKAKSWVYGVAMERAPVLTGITAGFLIQNPA
jgi:hypothetical protein